MPWTTNVETGTLPYSLGSPPSLVEASGPEVTCGAEDARGDEMVSLRSAVVELAWLAAGDSSLGGLTIVSGNESFDEGCGTSSCSEFWL